MKWGKVKQRLFPRNTDLLIGACLAMAMILFRERFYTSTIFGWAVLTIIVVRLLDRNLWGNNLYWKWIGITFIPFVVVNGILTSLPIVWYSDGAILGIRVGSIPVEDFLYSWSLLTLNLVIYKKLRAGD